MGIFGNIKRWFGMIFKNKAESVYGVKAIESASMDRVVLMCSAIYAGRPYWVSKDDHIKTINFAKSICSETARLTTLAIGIQIEGGERGEWLQKQVDSVYFRVRHWVEYGCAYGTIILKPNGTGLDVFTPNDFVITAVDDQRITGVIFKDAYTDNGKYYTRLEYHRFEDDGSYQISNRAYMSRYPDAIGDPVALENTKWKDLADESGAIVKANGEPLEKPMFAVFRTPAANNVDIDSAMGLPVFADAIEELKDLDVAYSRNALEVFDSEKIILADERLMVPDGAKIGSTPHVKLPHYVKNVFGSSAEDFYQEINPQLNTETRQQHINSLLSQIGYKCGFSNGYFVFDEKTGMVTATQVEADDRRTIQFIKDVRDQLEECVNDAVYALSLFADLYGITSPSEYEITYDFGDITYNREEDRARWWSYVVQGKVPAWMYFVKFEGMTEEDAKAMVEEAQPKEPRLFEEE